MVFFCCYFGLPTKWLAGIILLFHVKENVNNVFNRALFCFHFPHFRLKVPLLFNESVSGHLHVKHFSVLFPIATMSCRLQLSSITHNFYSLTRNMGIPIITNNSFYSFNFSFFTKEPTCKS